MCSMTIGMCLEWTCCTIESPSIIRNNQQHRSNVLKSCMYFGAIISAGPAAFIASLKGLRAMLIIALLITISGSILITYSPDALLSLCSARILHGLATGIVFVIVPNYAAEMAEPKFRGKQRKTIIILGLCEY